MFINPLVIWQNAQYAAKRLRLYSWGKSSGLISKIKKERNTQSALNARKDFMIKRIF